MAARVEFCVGGKNVSVRPVQRNSGASHGARAMRSVVICAQTSTIMLHLDNTS
jgi:hypothetical protein